MSKDREKLLDRVRKLYAMSRESEASPHEAEIALRRCQSLMARFGITESDLHTSEFGRTDTGQQFRAMPGYVTVLGASVALLHDCICVRGKSLEFRGYSIDSDVASITYAYLLEAMERSLRQRKSEGAVGPGRSASFDYRIGFASAIRERCLQIDRERRAADRTAGTSAGDRGTALMVRKRELVREHCTGGLGTARRRTIRYRSGDAHRAGESDGRSVSLNSAVLDD